MGLNMKTRKKVGIGNEGKMHKDFAKIIRQYEGYKRLNCLRWSYDASGEKRSVMTGSLLKAKGLKSGKADYEFIKKLSDNIAHYLYLEFKFGKGKQSDSQKEFEALFKDFSNVKYCVVYSIQEAIEILKQNGFLKC
jgi:hypothetical protein